MSYYDGALIEKSNFDSYLIVNDLFATKVTSMN